MVELAGVLIAAAVALLTAFRIPSLHHRVREHATIVKDLPGDMGVPLRDLLEDELREMARLGRRQLGRTTRYSGVGRLAGFLLTLPVVFALVHLLWFLMAPEDRSVLLAPEYWEGALAGYLMAGGILLVLGSWALVKANEVKSRREEDAAR